MASEHASDWLNAIPDPNLALKLDYASIRVACGLRQDFVAHTDVIADKWSMSQATMA